MALCGSKYETEELLDEIKGYAERLGMDTRDWHVRRDPPPTPMGATLWFLDCGEGSRLHAYESSYFLTSLRERINANAELCKIREVLWGVAEAQGRLAEGEWNGNTVTITMSREDARKFRLALSLMRHEDWPKWAYPEIREMIEERLYQVVGAVPPSDAKEIGDQS